MTLMIASIIAVTSLSIGLLIGIPAGMYIQKYPMEDEVTE